MNHIVKFGGLDVALRIDNTALFVMKLENGIFEEISNKIWGHIDPSLIRDDLLIIQRIERMNAIGYDRLGTGEVIKMFPKELPLIPVVSSMPTKQDIIGLMRGMFGAGKLKIHDDKLFKEIMEQETYKSDAGNILYRHPSGFHDDLFWACGYACYVATKYLIGLPRSVGRSAQPRRTADEELTRFMKDI